MTALLPAELAELPPHKVEELVCRSHLGVWTARKRLLEMAPLHWEWCELAMTENRLAVVAPREHPLALDTPVMVPGGWRKMGELLPGDVVVGGDGYPTVVTAVSPVYQDLDCYRLVLDDGQEFVASAGHEWVTHYAWRGHRVVTTAQIAADTAMKDYRKQTHVIDCVRVESEDVELPVDPWVLGYWLGNGGEGTGQFTCHLDDLEFLVAQTRRAYEVRAFGKDPRQELGARFGARELMPALRELGVLRCKHVPEKYLWSGTRQRLELLRGLLDADGCCSARGQVTIGQKRLAIADGVAQLVWSLGWKPKRYTASRVLDGRDYGPSYGVSFYPDEPVFRLPRKTARQRELGWTAGSGSPKKGWYARTPRPRRSKAGGRSVVACDRTLTVPTRCISTKAGSFLVGEAVTSRNSKTETFTVNATCWRSEQLPGLHSYVFCQTGDQAKTLLQRIVDAMEETHPWMVEKADVSSQRVVFTNGSKVDTAGAGKSVRGAHPDVVIGDDVLEESQCLSELQRRRTESWWKGTVGGMAHPGTKRQVRPFPGAPLTSAFFPPTKVFLVGTPFHEQDLLMSMRRNPMVRFRRYAAEFHEGELVAGTLAVEAN